MKYLALLVTAATLLLSGCATTLKTEVTAFQAWPAQMTDKSYVFDAAPTQRDTLEYRTYLGLVRMQLAQLGFTEPSDPNAAKLKVAMHFQTIDRPLRVMQAMDPFYNGPGYWGGRSFYRGGPWGYGGRYPGFYGGPWGSPFYGPMDVRESIDHDYERKLRVTIDTVSGDKLFDVTVQNNSDQASTATVMPAMITSAFAGFPGQNGVPHQLTLTLDDKGHATTSK